MDRAYEVEGERQSNVEEVYRVNHINQTFDFVCLSTLVMTISSAWFKSNPSSNAVSLIPEHTQLDSCSSSLGFVKTRLNYCHNAWALN